MIRLLFLVVVALPIKILACSCAIFSGPITIKDYNNSEIILSGKATKVTLDKYETTEKQRKIEFQIDEVFKGNIDTRTVTIYTSAFDASCGLNVKENEEWVIWAYTQNKGILTDLCTRSVQKKYLSEWDHTSLRYFRSNPATSEWKNEAGVLIATGQLENNIPIGHWTYFYKNGYIESEGSYKKGAYDGKWIKYFNPEGIVTRLRYDKKIPEDSIPDLRPLQHKIWKIEQYKEGVRDGTFISYVHHSTDRPTSISHYKNGDQDGRSIAYYPNGRLYYEQNFKNGKLDGYERVYYENGQLKSEGKFIEDKVSGEFRVYNEKGVLIKKAIDKRPE